MQNELLEQLQREQDALALEEQAHLDAKAEIEVLVKQSEEAIVQWQGKLCLDSNISVKRFISDTFSRRGE